MHNIQALSPLSIPSIIDLNIIIIVLPAEVIGFKKHGAALLLFLSCPLRRPCIWPSPHWGQQKSVSSQGNHEYQEGNPLGANYSGRISVTASGRTCQVWAAQQPHEHSTGTELGERNHCRNPDRDSGGVWCYTTDQDKLERKF